MNEKWSWQWKTIFFYSYRNLPFLDFFLSSQTPRWFLSFHCRIKTKPDLEGWHKTVFRNILSRFFKKMLSIKLVCYKKKMGKKVNVPTWLSFDLQNEIFQMFRILVSYILVQALMVYVHHWLSDSKTRGCDNKNKQSQAYSGLTVRHSNCHNCGNHRLCSIFRPHGQTF